MGEIEEIGENGGVKGIGSGGLGSARSWEDARVLMGGPRENPRSLSSPKLELRPKNSKKGGNGGLRGLGGRGRRWGDAGVLGEVHAKTTGLYQVPNMSYSQKTKNVKKSLFINR